jgi:VanZ family protein
MNKLIFILTLALVTLVLSCNKQPPDNRQTINPLLDDVSFISKFGHQPNATTDEDLRIKTHLEYVENLLRQNDCRKLTSSQKEKREHLLDLLHDYWTAGIFPRNYDYSDKRVPCFIDKYDRICAVGYLV